jgi:hypothetical protein
VSVGGCIICGLHTLVVLPVAGQSLLQQSLLRVHAPPFGVHWPGGP